MEEYDQGLFIGEHKYCISSEFPVKVNGKKRKTCHSSDALVIYEHETPTGEVYYDATCFSCRQAFSKDEVHRSSLSSELGISPQDGTVKTRVNFSNKASKKTKITREERDSLWKKTGWEAHNYRSLSDEILKFYGHRTLLNPKNQVIAQYYPETENGSLLGYKSKHNPKKYGYDNVGRTGVNSDLSGQHKFPDGGKYALLVGGEDDKIAAQMMLRAYQKQKGQDDYNHYSVVSPTAGEPSAVRQCRKNYEWFDKHDIIVIGLDNDEVGNEVAEEIAKILPKEKVRIAKWADKDPNNMLQLGKQKQFLSNFFGAKEYINSGIFSSANLMSSIKEALHRPRLSLPPHMHKLQEMTKGAGLIRGRIYNIIGDTSVGKSSHTNSMVYHWIFQPNDTVGVVSLEATNGEYGVDILSLHLEKNLYWVDENNIDGYLDTPEVQEKSNELFFNEYGESRFYILDDREGTVKSLEKKCEQLYKQYGCGTIVIDVTTDLLRILSIEQQAEHFNWQSNFVKNGVTLINVLHTRKPPASRDGIPKKPDEYDTLGSSIFVQKAAGNIVIYRNKNVFNSDPIESNTTYIEVPKMRQGQTGKAGAWYYDQETRQVFDRDDFFKEHPEKVPKGYDFTYNSFDKEYWEEGGRGRNSVCIPEEESIF